MDPNAVIATISAGLSLIDQFRALALKILDKPASPPSTHAEARDGALEISHAGRVDFRISASQIRMGAWDELRYRTLEGKVRTRWEIFNDIDGQLPLASADERARLKARLADIRQELCKDFREMLALYEITLGVPLGDHYALQSVCSGAP